MHTKTAANPSLLEFVPATPAAAPTKSLAPTPPPHPLHPNACHPSSAAASPAAIPAATSLAALPLGDPATARPPILSSRSPAPPIVQFAYKLRTPRQRTATLAHAALSYPSIH